MAGVMYLGNQMVSPVIVQGNGGGYIGREVTPEGKYQMQTSSEFVLPDEIKDIGDRACQSLLTIGSTHDTYIETANFNNLENISGDYALYSAFVGSTNLTTVDLSNLKTITGDYSLNGTFDSCPNLTSVDLRNLVTASGRCCMQFGFQNCQSLTSVNLRSLTTVGYVAMDSSFNNCSNLSIVDLSSLTSITGEYGFNNTFRNCSKLSSLEFTNLSNINASRAMYQIFNGCSGLKSLSFPALKTTSFGSYTDQFSGMMRATGTSVTHTLHFPSNLESTIQGLSGYPNFSGTNGYVVLAFDLPATL